MKTEKQKDAPWILSILIIPGFVLMALFFLLYTPVDFLRYYFSDHRREMRRLNRKEEKYTWLATLTSYYRVYNLVRRYRLPIRYIRVFGTGVCTYGYFYCNRVLFLTDAVPYFDFEAEKWIIAEEDDMEDYVRSEVDLFDERMEHDDSLKCERVVFLVKEKGYSGEERALAEKADFILLYNEKDFADRVNRFLREQAIA